MKNSNLLIVILVVGTLGSNSSCSISKHLQADTVYTSSDVDKVPTPKGGMEELYSKWIKEVQYPEEARKKGVQGKVYVYIIINEKGKIIESGVEEGIGLECDEVALKAFKEIKLKWEPGIKDGIKVKVKLVIPFTFKLG